MPFVEHGWDVGLPVHDGPYMTLWALLKASAVHNKKERLKRSFSLTDVVMFDASRRDAPAFQRRFEVGHKDISRGAIDEAMVEAEAKPSPATDGDHVGAIDLHDHRDLLDVTHTQDSDLGLINDRRSDDGAVVARVGQGEGATRQLIGHDLPITRTVSEVSDGA